MRNKTPGMLKAESDIWDEFGSNNWISNAKMKLFLEKIFNILIKNGTTIIAYLRKTKKELLKIGRDLLS